MEKAKVVIKSCILSVKKWVRKNPLEFWILVAILVIGAFCRLYKIDQYMTFLGDEGRDVLIVRRIFVEAHPPLIGPGTSVGNMYLGPLYYYMMAIPLLITGFSPVGPSVMVATLGIATIAFVWWVGRIWFGKIAGLIAAILYALSPTVIYYARSSWNPNIMPFFALLSIYSIWKIWQEKKFNWLIILGISFAFVMQSHYLGLLLFPTLFVFYILTFVNLKLFRNSKFEIRNFLQKSLFGFLIFAVLMSPLLIFDIRHGFINTNALVKLITERGSTISTNIAELFSKIPSTFNLINLDLVSAGSAPIAIIVSLSILALFIFVLVNKNIKDKSPYFFVFTWLALGVLGLSFYKLPIYAHYLGFIFIPPFLLIGAFFANLIKFSKVTAVLATLAFCALLALNISKNPFWKEPNRLMKRSQDVARKVLSLDGDKPFNLAVLAQTNYEDGYRYFLELWGGEVLHADRWDPATISDQLFVICEYEESKCDPTHSPKAEVANFGWSDIEGEWEVDGVFIYKLVHSKATPESPRIPN